MGLTTGGIGDRLSWLLVRGVRLPRQSRGAGRTPRRCFRLRVVSEGAAAVFALRGAGSGAGVVMGRHAVLLPALRVAAAAAAAPPGSLLSVSREETLPDSPRRGEKSRPWARSQVPFNDGTRRTTAPAAIPRWCPTLKPPVSSTTKTRTMLGSEQGEVAGRPGPRACRRHGARRLIICARGGRASH